MTNVVKNNVSSILGAGDFIDRWRYREKLHGGEDCSGYNLYEDIVKGNYWLGTEGCPQQILLTDRQKVAQAILHNDVKELIPDYLLPAGASHHRRARDLGVVDPAESDTGFLAHQTGGEHETHVVGVNIPGGDGCHELYAI